MEEPASVPRPYNPLLPKPAPRMGQEGHHWLDDMALQASCPRIHALFDDSSGIETSHRLPATLLLFVDQGRLKACWSDRTTSQVLFQTLELSDPFWEQLEGYLSVHMDEWKQKKAWGKR